MQTGNFLIKQEVNKRQSDQEFVNIRTFCLFILTFLVSFRGSGLIKEENFSFIWEKTDDETEFNLRKLSLNYIQ